MAVTNAKTNPIRPVLLLLLVGLGLVTGYLLYAQWYARYEVLVIRTPTGWGYDIRTNGKPLIHQPTIPGQPGMVAFPNQEQARRVGERVVEKFKTDGGTADADQ